LHESNLTPVDVFVLLKPLLLLLLLLYSAAGLAVLQRSLLAVT
jgi:hypothetical protein